MELIFLQNPYNKGGTVYLIYEKLSQLTCKTIIEHLKSAQQDDLGKVIAEEQLQTALEEIHSMCKIWPPPTQDKT